MVRIESEEKNTKVEDLEAEINKLKKGLKRKENRKIFNCGTCTIIVLVFIITLGLFVSYLTAKTGLKEVPFFTAKFYHEPRPDHLVVYNQLPQKDKDIKEILKSRATQEAFLQGSSTELDFNLDLSEEQLTAIIRDQINNDNSLQEKVEYVQLAVLADSLELFVKNKQPQNLIITINFKPRVIDDKIDLKITKLKIGDLALPEFIGNIFLAEFTEKSFNGALKALSGFAKIKQINLSAGILSIELFINNIKLFL